MTVRGVVVLDLSGPQAVTHYTPAVDVTPLLTRASSQRVPELVRQTHTICVEAQGLASRLAIDAALGHDPGDAVRAARQAACMGEAAREHGLRIALDWPRVIGEAPNHAMARTFIAAGNAAHAEPVAATIAEHVTDSDPVDWLAIGSQAALVAWARAGRTTAARFFDRLLALPALAVEGDVEPGSLVARHGDHALLRGGVPAGSPLARHCARLIDLCRLPAAMTALARGVAAPWGGISSGAGQGRAEVECARGLLVHAVELRGEGIGRYDIDAPTDRTFANGGSAARLFARLGASDPMTAELAMLALDPCVPYRIEVA